MSMDLDPKSDPKLVLVPSASGERGISSLPELGDDELMMLTRGGARKAFDVLVNRYQGQVLRVAGKYLRHPEVAKDVAQNTFLEVYRYRKRYRPQGKFRPFLFRVLLNQCRMSVRRAAKKRRGNLESEPECELPLPEDKLLRREQMLEVERALGKLSKRVREVVVLRYAGEMSQQEVADTLKIPIGTVKSRISAGLEKMRKMLLGGLP